MEFIQPRNLKYDTNDFIEIIKTPDGKEIKRPLPLNKNTMIIAGFPGIGKTHEFLKYAGTGTICVDSDSSKFHWVMNNGKKETDPEWPNNYRKNILEYIGKVNYLCVSTHKETITILKDLNVPFILVYPKRQLKEEYLQRYKKRGSDETFVSMMNDKWDSFLNDMESTSCFLKIELKSGEYLGDGLFNMEYSTMEQLTNAWNEWLMTLK